MRKSVPNMDDNFVVVFVTRASFMLSLLFSLVGVVLPQKPAFAQVSNFITYSSVNLESFNSSTFSGFAMDNMDQRSMN